MNETATTATPRPARPWWRFGMVWLVLAVPASAVVGGVAMVVIAMSQPDTLVSADYYRRGIEINKTLLPAQQGRNHVATPAR